MGKGSSHALVTAAVREGIGGDIKHAHDYRRAKGKTAFAADQVPAGRFPAEQVSAGHGD